MECACSVMKLYPCKFIGIQGITKKEKAAMQLRMWMSFYTGKKNIYFAWLLPALRWLNSVPSKVCSRIPLC